MMNDFFFYIYQVSVPIMIKFKQTRRTEHQVLADNLDAFSNNPVNRERDTQYFATLRNLMLRFS
jgi:hypothetical protein